MDVQNGYGLNKCPGQTSSWGPKSTFVAHRRSFCTASSALLPVARVRKLQAPGRRVGATCTGRFVSRFYGQCVAHLYHEYRPHQGLGGRTPNEVYVGERPANERARIEPRAKWPTWSPCALHVTPMRGQPGRVVELVVQHLDDDARFPIVELKSAA
jgi:hypothetical protein